MRRDLRAMGPGVRQRLGVVPPRSPWQCDPSLQYRRLSASPDGSMLDVWKCDIERCGVALYEAARYDGSAVARRTSSSSLGLEQVDTILDSIGDGVFTVDKDFLITSFNRAAEEITGFSAKEAIGEKCLNIFRAPACQTGWLLVTVGCQQPLRVGSVAPDFSGVTDEGKVIKLGDLMGDHGMVLYFYPKGETLGCVAQACAFRDRLGKLHDRGYTLRRDQLRLSRFEQGLQGQARTALHADR